MVVSSSEPGATAELGPSEAGSARKLLLDDMLAERDRAPLPPAPVLTVRPAPVDAAPVGAGRRGALRRLAEVEALARNNLRAAEEAQRVMYEERQLLEEEASARTRAERTAGSLRRELERLRSTEEQRAAQARFAATHQARTELATEMERVHGEHARVVDELDRMRGTLFDHDSLLDEYSQRLHDEQEAQAKARADLVRAEEGQRAAERNLEIATETARRRAEDDHARLVKVEEELRDTVVERDRAAAELRSITNGDGELARLRVQAEATHEDMTRLLADLDVQAARGDKAETELATTREACAQAERVAADATEARDLAGISLETTRSELAALNEVLDAERTSAQTRIADLGAQLTTITRTAESATAQVADLEARLDEVTSARDGALARAEELDEKLGHAVADADQLRTHAASIGDELAATHISLHEVRDQLEEARRPEEPVAPDVPAVPVVLELVQPIGESSTPDAESTDREPEAKSSHPTPSETPVELPASAPSPFDAAIASAFGEVIDPDTKNAAVELDSKRRVSAGVDADPPVTTYRTVDSPLERTSAGGPIVEHEEALLRQVAPVDPEPAGTSESDENDGESPAEPPMWRRTAMAALTALAADSDDLTPRRRR